LLAQSGTKNVALVSGPPQSGCFRCKADIRGQARPATLVAIDP
jgi:hypothetical protein